MTENKLVWPTYLTIDSIQQRKNFDQLNDIEAANLKEGITNSSSPWSVSDGRIKAPKRRNRYSNVFPFNHNRVKLPCTKKNDYINASRVQIDEESKYIVTQGPIESTIHHFWAMCFNESELNNTDTIVIVMLTSLVEDGIFKCIQYWPNDINEVNSDASSIEDKIDIGSLRVKFLKKSYNKEGDFSLTELELKSATKVKKVYHYYYYKWADARTPPSSESLQILSSHIHEHDNETTGKIIPIVHCSAGVGRSGTFIALDYFFKNPQLFKSENIDPNQFGPYNPSDDLILNTVSTLRHYRMMMVQTIHQYIFLYDTVIKLYKQINSTS
ncbi:protein-tyrosine phosphatase-like protein [Scheffersomyces coipomensis]|uniref:protein-tyrosine phosphatase-like protein n=1 Tax=Scheffersomyces coipomensis TaxID=1788519 RepID=UPI00315C611A